METAPQEQQGRLGINAEVVRDLLIRFLKDESASAGFSKAVVGLSGGVDSAVAAALSAEALGRDNVFGVLLPYRESNPESEADAKLVAGRLGIRSEKVDLTAIADACFEAVGVKDRVRRGNVLARLRMIVLYDVSAREGALVIGTSNKTELLLGYGTLHGDMASALNPLGDLYKTQVWQLARSLNLPARVVEKKPSADLWEGQSDEDELGFTYRDVDQLLYAMVDERRSEEELMTLGFTQDFIRRVQNRIRRNQFKRRPPVIAKISYRTLNVDFRYVRDWGI